jgi:hypothetical protein
MLGMEKKSILGGQTVDRPEHLIEVGESIISFLTQPQQHWWRMSVSSDKVALMFLTMRQLSWI